MPQAKAKVSALIQGARLVLTAFSLQLTGYFYQGSFAEIGIVLMVFILASIITLFFVIHHRGLNQQT
jgi:MFS transporter, DHA1 family, multidrug resistance protein